MPITIKNRTELAISLLSSTDRDKVQIQPQAIAKIDDKFAKSAKQCNKEIRILADVICPTLNSRSLNSKTTEKKKVSVISKRIALTKVKRAKAKKDSSV